MIGQPLDSLPTPVLYVDLGAMERNSATMAACITGHGKDWRPHVKAHRCPAIAERLVATGAIGVTCATLDEAEQMAAAGIEDILLANLTVGAGKVQRLAALCEPWAPPPVCRVDDDASTPAPAHRRYAPRPIATCDHFAQIGPLAEACRARGVTCRVVVEVDIGMNRVGIRPGSDARDLARAIDRLEGVKLVGVMGYEGHLLTVPDPDEKRRRITEAIGVLVHTRNVFDRDGLSTEIVSAGGTGSYPITATLDGVTELQAGGGIFGDLFCRDDCNIEGHEPSLFVRSTVVSRPTFDRAVVDAGRKTLSGELHMPAVRGLPDATVTRLSAEHGVLALGPDSRDLVIGDRIDLEVGYSDFTCVLHREIVGLRDGIVESTFPIGGRGRG